MLGQRRPLTLLAVAAGLAAALLIGSCGGGGGSKPTGISDVDTVIKAVESQDLQALVANVKYFQAPCSTNPQVSLITLYAPPHCPASTANGTPIDVLIGNFAACNPGPLARTDAEQQLQRNVALQKQAVFAVVSRPEPILQWKFDYMLMLAPVGQPNATSSTVVGIRNGGISAAVAWCDPASAAVSTFTTSGGKVIYKAPTPAPSPQ